jgi:hypothetical protein
MDKAEMNLIFYMRLGKNPSRKQIENLLLEYKVPLKNDKISFERMEKLLKKMKNSIERRMLIVDKLNQVLDGKPLYDDWFIDYLDAPENLKKEYEKKYFE